MAPKEGIFTNKAPKPLPQFSQAVKHNGMVYCSGNIGLDPATGKQVEGTVKDRTVSWPLSHIQLFSSATNLGQRQTLKNLSAILGEAGSSLTNVVKMNIFLTTMDNFAAMNEAYDEFFTIDPKPVRPNLLFLSSKTLTIAGSVPHVRSRLPATLRYGCGNRVHRLGNRLDN